MKTIFQRHEEGSVLVIVGFAILVMVAAVGVAVDIARYLMVQTKISSALDNATLAAAATVTTSTAPSDLNAVAQNYFNANFPSGYMGSKLQSVTIAYDPATNRVTGTVTGETPLSLMRIFNIANMNVASLSEVSWTNAADLELVLTVDVSPSMCDPEYVRSLKPKGSPIGVAPTVPISDPTCGSLRSVRDAANALLDELLAGVSGTTVLENVHFGLVTFNHNVMLPTPNVPPSYSPYLGNSPYGPGNNPQGPYNVSIIGLTSDVNRIRSGLDQLHTATDAWTRTNVGTNAAWMMIRPDHRAYFQHESPLLPRDFEPTRRDKVVVLMTDGNNVVQRDGSNKFVVTVEDNTDQANRCDLMKQQGIIIYSVVFETTTALDNTAIDKIFKDCATKPSYYYYAKSGAALKVAYENIGRSLRKLWLSR